MTAGSRGSNRRRNSSATSLTGFISGSLFQHSVGEKAGRDLDTFGQVGPFGEDPCEILRAQRLLLDGREDRLCDASRAVRFDRQRQRPAAMGRVGDGEDIALVGQRVARARIQFQRTAQYEVAAGIAETGNGPVRLEDEASVVDDIEVEYRERGLAQREIVMGCRVQRSAELIVAAKTKMDGAEALLVEERLAGQSRDRVIGTNAQFRERVGIRGAGAPT